MLDGRQENQRGIESMSTDRGRLDKAASEAGGGEFVCEKILQTNLLKIFTCGYSNIGDGMRDGHSIHKDPLLRVVKCVSQSTV